MLSVLPLACAAALYPSLLAGVIVMLTRPVPRPLLVGFLLGGLLISVTSGLIILVVVGGAISTSRQNAASPKIDLIAGILSFVLAAGFWARRHTSRLGQRTPDASGHPSTTAGRARNLRRSNESITNRMLAHGSPRAAFTLGLILNLPGIWYLVALKDIAKANDGPVASVVLILVSSSTATPRIAPISFGGNGPLRANVVKTATMTAPAAKITRPVLAMLPTIADLASPPVWSQCSLAEDSRNTV
jgi:Sap, sulfolipid-1-addressing protein